MISSKPLTFRQQQVLDFIRANCRSGYPPTLREIAAHIGAQSLNGANYFLEVLERKGHLTRVRGTSRGIRLAEAPQAETLIVCDPRIRSGWPCIAGTRLGVELVAGSIAAGDTIEQYALDKEVTVDQVRAALAVYEGMRQLFEARAEVA